MLSIVETLSQAKALHRAGRVRDAELLYRQVLDADAEHFEALCLLGVACHALCNHQEAVTILERAVRLQPDYGEAHNCLAIALAELGRLDDAIASFERAVAANSGSAEFARNLRNAHATKETALALALVEQGKWDEAESCYRRALQWEPNRAATLGNFGNLLSRRARPDEAAACYRRVLELEPQSAEVHYNLGLIAKEQLRLDEAAAWFRRAVELNPDYAQAHGSLGATLLQQRQPDEAADCFRRALELKSDYLAAHLGLAFSLLQRGKFAEGWPEYEWRLPRKNASAESSSPRWDGSPLAGRTLLLRSEQGFGDSLQFVRYAELVRQDGRVILESRPTLARLLATCPGVDAVVPVGEPLPNFDIQIPLLSIPGLVGTSLETIPAKVPYLFPAEESIDRWRARLGQPKGLKVGIAWQGDPTQPIDPVRSIPLTHFAPLGRIPGVQLYSLQMGAGREQLGQWSETTSITDLGDRAGDFEETAAIMRNLDLVISSDSSPAHLAGALGINVWVALSFAPDWRWLLERDDCPWYPTMRLFRQPRAGDWNEVFGTMERELASIV